MCVGCCVLCVVCFRWLGYAGCPVLHSSLSVSLAMDDGYGYSPRLVENRYPFGMTRYYCTFQTQNSALLSTASLQHCLSAPPNQLCFDCLLEQANRLCTLPICLYGSSSLGPVPIPYQ
ncbi:hypothetical protein K402DRAFT_391381 [Aulographum hederae CBS 113979]|uniref:Secreted protein n=1 Tax=Aulographum hederae CBS 113979 TaxID=1176131 RepID=A0A6G1H840_9PEZI|nr:hypothetical protein K402DRAFT_391381 [Aulographum hederae CBS 113979]